MRKWNQEKEFKKRVISVEKMVEKMQFTIILSTNESLKCLYIVKYENFFKQINIIV